jgi:hypothetical protein
MSSLPEYTLNSYSFVALGREFCPLNFLHKSKYLSIGEESFLPLAMSAQTIFSSLWEGWVGPGKHPSSPFRRDVRRCKWENTSR